MANAKKCDECGVLFNDPFTITEYEYRNLGEVNLSIKINCANTDERKDICPKCLKPHFDRFWDEYERTANE